MTKPKELSDFQRKAGANAFGPDFEDNISKGLCPQCKRPALEHCYSDAGRIDVGIHGLCEECFDQLLNFSCQNIHITHLL